MSIRDCRDFLVQRIIKECDDNNVAVAKDFVSLLVNLYKLNSELDYSTDDGADDGHEDDGDDDDDNDEILVNRISDELLNYYSNPHLFTLKMQFYFAKFYLNRNEIIKKTKQKIQKKINPILNEIFEIRKVNSEREIEKFYQKLLIFITIASGIENPTSSSVLKKTSMALQSVYLPSEVTNLVRLPRKDKEKQLMNLMRIVTGIRLFNKSRQRGEEDMENLPGILKETIGKSRNLILKLLEELMRAIYQLTACVENFLTDEMNTKVLNGNGEINDYFWIIKTLTAYRQQEIYIRKLLSDVEACENEFKTFMELFQIKLLKLCDTVKFRSAIPIVQVYPQFMDLTEIWMHFQNELIILNQINSFFYQLQSLNENSFNADDGKRLGKFLKNVKVFSDAERLERSMGQIISECGNCPMIYPNPTNEFEKIHLEFQGFCAWTFVAGYGALIPGNPNIGVAKWNGKYFVFSSKKAAKFFGSDPNKYLYEALKFIREHPEYIHFFNIHSEIEDMTNEETLSTNVQMKITHQNQSIQTDVHFRDSYIDPNYHHSIWEYRKRVLKLVHLTECRTKSTQTNLSLFRKKANTQTLISSNKKDISTNTMIHKNI